MTTLNAAETFGRLPGIDLSRERFRVRVEPCACGTHIVAETDPATWPESVSRHNHGVAHTRWWARHIVEWQGEE